MVLVPLPGALEGYHQRIFADGLGDDIRGVQLKRPALMGSSILSNAVTTITSRAMDSVKDIFVPIFKDARRDRSVVTRRLE